jgi:hypothetical protein
MPVFFGLAFAARQLGRWEAAAEAYWRCCSFQEQNAPYSAYHASWAWELLNAMRKYKGDGAAEPYAAYCRRVFRIYFGPGVFGVVASEARLKQALDDSEGPIPASPSGYSPSPARVEAAPPTAAAPSSPSLRADASPIEFRVEKEERSVRVVVSLGTHDKATAEVAVAADAVTVRLGADEVSIPVPPVVPDEVPPVKYSRKRNELSLELPLK